MARNRRKLPNVAVPVESRLYSDGLFSFSVNVSPAGSGAGQQYYRQGRRTIQTEVRAGNEITIVGELLPATAKRIADSILSRYRRNDERVGHGGFVATGRSAAAL